MNGKHEQADTTGRSANPDTGAPVTSAAIATLRSEDLFNGSREIIIAHQGDQYRLRCTSKGKLILTK